MGDTNHDRFLGHLEASKSAVWLVARWLSDHGHPVTVRPTTAAKTREDWRDHADDGDIEIIQRVEVKHLSAEFTGSADWPFNNFIVCAKHAWDGAITKPYRICYLSKDRSAVAVLDPSATEKQWKIERKNDSRYDGESQEFYVCAPDLVRFGKIKGEVDE